MHVIYCVSVYFFPRVKIYYMELRCESLTSTSCISYLCLSALLLYVTHLYKVGCERSTLCIGTTKMLSLHITFNSLETFLTCCNEVFSLVKQFSLLLSFLHCLFLLVLANRSTVLAHGIFKPTKTLLELWECNKLKLIQF